MSHVVVHERFAFGRDSTLGRLIVPGVERPIFILEDQVRDGPKVQGETAIPVGTYKLELRTEGPTHARYLDRFPDIHRGMIHLLDVPDFKYIQMHPGNDDDDTEGCPLTGDDAKVVDMGATEWEYEIVGGQATPAYVRVYPKISDLIEEGETYWEVRGEYR